MYILETVGIHTVTISSSTRKRRVLSSSSMLVTASRWRARSTTLTNYHGSIQLAPCGTPEIYYCSRIIFLRMSSCIWRIKYTRIIIKKKQNE